MIKNRAYIEVSVFLDPIPGWGNDPEDHVRHIQRALETSIPHYKPRTKLIRVVRMESDEIR